MTPPGREGMEEANRRPAGILAARRHLLGDGEIIAAGLEPLAEPGISAFPAASAKTPPARWFWR